MPEPALYPSPAFESSIPVQEPTSTLPTVSLPGKVEWTYGLHAATLAGIVAAVLMISSRGAFGIGIFATGSLAVVLYRRRNPDANVTIWMGTRLGLISGLIGFGISSAFVVIVTLLTGTERLRTFLVDMAKQAPLHSPNADTQQMFEYLLTPAGFPGLALLYLCSFLIIFLIFSAIGGALGAVWARLRRRR
jgi:hypothetical protein